MILIDAQACNRDFTVCVYCSPVKNYMRVLTIQASWITNMSYAMQFDLNIKLATDLRSQL